MSKDLKALLEDAVAFVPEERHSVPAIVAAARRDRTRRTRIVVPLAVAAMMVVAGVAPTTLAVNLGQGCRIAALAVTATRVGLRELCDEEVGPVEVYGIDGERQVSVVDGEAAWLELTSGSLLLAQPDEDGGARLMSYDFADDAWTWLPTGRNPVLLGGSGPKSSSLGPARRPLTTCPRATSRSLTSVERQRGRLP